MPRRLKASAWALALVGLSTVVLLSAMNRVLHSDFRSAPPIPALAGIAGIVACIVRG
jgi:hypothetical protein